MKKSEEAAELFMAGACCAQAVLGAFADEIGLSHEQAFKLASGFGAGMGRMREVCGCVSAMVIIANLTDGYSDIHDKSLKDAHYERIQALIRQFEAQEGSVVCRDLLGLLSQKHDSPVSDERTAAYYATRPCTRLVMHAAELIQQYLLNKTTR